MIFAFRDVLITVNPGPHFLQVQDGKVRMDNFYSCFGKMILQPLTTYCYALTACDSSYPWHQLTHATARRPPACSSIELSSRMARCGSTGSPRPTRRRGQSCPSWPPFTAAEGQGIPSRRRWNSISWVSDTLNIQISPLKSS